MPTAAGVPGEPRPRCASTAHPAARSSRHATVTVSGEQPTAAASVARVTATCRPVAWSACSAIAAAIATNVAGLIDTPAASAATAYRAELLPRRARRASPRD